MYTVLDGLPAFWCTLNGGSAKFMLQKAIVNYSVFEPEWVAQTRVGRDIAGHVK